MSGPLADRDWRLVGPEAHTGSMAMALDEVAARTASSGGPRTVRVYRWRPPTLSLGYSQDPATVDWERCSARGVDVVRRQTGGGGIYHDPVGDLSYSVVVPASEVPGDRLASYRRLLDPVFDALDRLGVDAGFADAAGEDRYAPACYLRGLHPAHDVVAPAGAGRKLCGNAQYRTREAVVQHGSLSVRRRPAATAAVFAGEGATAAAVRERVTSLRERTDAGPEAAEQALTAALRDWADADAGAWTAAELRAARELVREKYATAAWTRRGET
jgi:lipoate-protein ligase A